MKVQITLAAAMVFLLVGASVQAQTVIFDPNDATKAIGIENLDIGGVTTNVEFTNRQPAAVTYGDFPGFILNLQDPAAAATDAVNDALNAQGGVFGVGAEILPLGAENYFVGYNSELENDLRVMFSWESGTTNNGDFWTRGSANALNYNEDDAVWAVFDPQIVPEPGSALLLALGLVGLGAVARRRKAIA